VTRIEPSEFLAQGGEPQQRYELLRSYWVESASAGRSSFASGLLGLLRMPWGRRLFHFGLLGLLDEDPTDGGRFAVVPHAPPSSASASSAPRCARMLLDATDGESRLREAYRWLLAPAEWPALPRAAEEE
jgi:hypothetical protein